MGKQDLLKVMMRAAAEYWSAVWPPEIGELPAPWRGVVQRLAPALVMLALAACAAPHSAPATGSPLPGPTSLMELPVFSAQPLPPMLIVVPADGFKSRTPIITLVWAFKHTMAADEHFAVFLWREGNAPAMVALTDDRYFYAGEWIRLHGEGPGSFLWKVLPVRVAAGQPPVALTQDMPPRRFEVDSLEVPTPIMTPVNLVEAASPTPPPSHEFAIRRVVGDVKEVTAIAFAPDGRMFFNQKEGLVRVVAGGQLQPDPVISFPADTLGERGLIGIAIDPAFADNHYVWVSLTRAAPDAHSHPENQVIRFVEREGHGSDPQVALNVPLLTDSPAHQVGNLHFGPDGMLYLSMGDNGDRANAQNLSTIPGKIHRFAPAVPLTAPPDNPFSGSTVYALGFRNSWGFAIDPVSKALFAGDNGEACDDEVNRVVPKGNYGWHPSYLCDDNVLLDAHYPYTPPLVYFTPAIVPTGMAFYTGDQLPAWHNDLFFCSLILGKLLRLELNETRTGYTRLTQIDLGERGCWAALAAGPDGSLYYSSANAIYHLVAP